MHDQSRLEPAEGAIPPGAHSVAAPELTGVGGMEGEGVFSLDAEPMGLVAGRSEHRPGEARQGHAYTWKGVRVIALEGGAFPRVVYVYSTVPWVSQPFNVQGAELVPMPMRYFHGQVPA